MNSTVKSMRNVPALVVAPFLFLSLLGCPELPNGNMNENGSNDNDNASNENDNESDNVQQLIEEGRAIFRFDTFGDEIFWGDALQLHQAIAGEANGGMGLGLSPQAALDLGLKVDATALPSEVSAGIIDGSVDLNDPASTLVLLQNDAVVGLTGFFDEGGALASVGIQCALCHSTVDDSFAPGIGERLDGWANRDLNVGAIIALAPNLTPIADVLGTDVETVETVLNAWGPGKFDASLLLDGQGFRPDGATAATLIPPAFGLAGVNLHTFTGWGSVPYWNAFVAVIEMHGQGNFFDPRLDDAEQFPVAAANGFGNIESEVDLVSSKLPALHLYQLSLQAPAAPAGSFDEAAAEAGDLLFEGKANCASCHMAPTFSDAGWNLHTAEEIGIDDFQSSRSPELAYRTTPLRGLWTHTEGGFYHDGRFETLLDVVNHYDAHFGLGLTEDEKSDLVEYLKSL